MTPFVTRQGQTVDMVCWEHYRRTADITEIVFDANPGLADLGPVLPMGTRILLPDLPVPQREARKLTSLWD
ncbi:tail protein X [Bosea sp. MMO-172]|uniref:tail protein X n=1 Tax=Bosea sp. MMO-172 TaxID=3127885 RepID=UPI00301A95EC